VPGTELIAIAYYIHLEKGRKQQAKGDRKCRQIEIEIGKLIN
jgi:hypothetical protein